MKHTSSASSRDSSPQRSKDKEKSKTKNKKKKNRGGKGDKLTTPDDSPVKSKKYLSPLKKTLKVKKLKNISSTIDLKEMMEEDEAAKKRSPTPQPSRQSHSREFLADDPVSLNRLSDPVLEWGRSHSRGRSLEKRGKKRKNKHSQSPQGNRGGAKKRDVKQEESHDRKARNSDQVALKPTVKDVHKGLIDDRRKRSPPPSERFSPSQWDQDPLYTEEQAGRLHSAAPVDFAKGDRSFSREDDRRTDRVPRIGEPVPPPPVVGRRVEGEGFDQYTPGQPRYDERGRGQDLIGEREQRVRGPNRFDREPLPRVRAEVIGWDQNFERRDPVRRDGSREGARDFGRDGSRDRGRGTAQDRGENRDRDGVYFWFCLKTIIF